VGGPEQLLFGGYLVRNTMKTKELIEGMNILSKYYEQNGFNTGAEHDVIYMYEPDMDITLEDFAKLLELGWDQEDGGWKAFV